MDIVSGRLIGRQHELSLFDSIVTDASHGVGRVVLCSGVAGIGKTRLAQEFSGAALAVGCPTAWGRCLEVAGAPPLWPWRQILRTLRIDFDALSTGVSTPTAGARFEFYQTIADRLSEAAAERGLLLVLDDIQFADESSLLVLDHLAAQAAASGVVVFATVRDGDHQSASLGPLLGRLRRAPSAELMPLSGFSRAEVGEQLGAGGEDSSVLSTVMEATGGNPLFVREIAREISRGTWVPDRPPASVIELVRARVDGLEVGCRAFVQAAAIVGRQFSVGLVAEVTDTPVDVSLRHLDQAVAAGLVDIVGLDGELRFTHALIRDSVAATLPLSQGLALHRRIALTLEKSAVLGDDEVSEIAGHWLRLADFGEADEARRWGLRAAEAGVRGLAFQEAERLYQVVLGIPAAWPDETDKVLAHLAHAQTAQLAGELEQALDAVRVATRLAVQLERPDLVVEAALVVEPVADRRINEELTRLCIGALLSAEVGASVSLHARLLARRSNLAYYAGDRELTEQASDSALDLARLAEDDSALTAALRARYQASPGPSGRAVRERLAAELSEVAQRAGDLQSAMWARLGGLDVLMERGRIQAADEALIPLEGLVSRLGGSANHWHLDRLCAAVAQAQGGRNKAISHSERGYARMRTLEPAAANGSYLGLHCALARHFPVSPEVVDYVRGFSEPPPGFHTMAQVARAYILLRAGHRDDATAVFQQAGPTKSWNWPSFFQASGHVIAAHVAIGLNRPEELAFVQAHLEGLRGEHVVASGVHYLGPAELTLGLAALTQGRWDDAVHDLAVAAEVAENCGTPGFAAEASHHLARALLARGSDGDSQQAAEVGAGAQRMITLLGMSGFVDLQGAVMTGEAISQRDKLSARESEVAGLVARGLTNRQIATELFISERTAGNHVQHILTKLDFTSRSQIVAWSLGGFE